MELGVRLGLEPNLSTIVLGIRYIVICTLLGT